MILIICKLLGPSGLNALRNIVQIGTISQFGVLFMLFVLGLEFHLEKIKSIWKLGMCNIVKYSLLMLVV